MYKAAYTLKLEIPAGQCVLIGMVQIRSTRRVNISMTTCAGPEEFQAQLDRVGMDLLLWYDLTELIFKMSLPPIQQFLIDRQTNFH